MKHRYDITINGEYLLCDLTWTQAHWLVFALFLAGYCRGMKRPCIHSRLVTDVPETYCIYINNTKQLDICLTAWQANLIVFLLHCFGHKSAEKVSF